MRRAAALLASAALGALGAAELAVADMDPVLRAGVPWRATVRAGPGLAPPVRLEARLEAAGRVLAAERVELADAGPLAAGVRLVLVAEELPAGAEADLILRLVDAGGAPAEAVRHLPTLASLRAARERQAGVAQADPSPWRRLAVEQAAELLLGEPPTLGELTAAAHRLDRLERGEEGADDGERAWIDPVDGSAQPWRLHRPPGPVRALAVLLRPLTGLRKCDWPPPPAAWLAAADAAGIAVVEPYPAGDQDGSGVLARRAGAVLAEAAARCPSGIPSFAVTAAPGLAHVEAWQAAAGTTLPAPPASALTAWAGGPFVVVVGSSEHLAAARANRALAESFVAAWAAHAHGIPPVVDERSFTAERWAGHHLVLIGNPRSNRVAAQVLPALPLAWDERSLSWPEGDGRASLLRSDRHALALVVPLAGRVALLLDGGPAWTGGGLPLAGIDGDWLLLGADGARRAGGVLSR